MRHSVNFTEMASVFGCSRFLVRLNSRFPTKCFKSAVKKSNIIYNSRFLTNSAVFLAGRKYSEKHEWVEQNGNIGTIGITHYAQDALGDIVYAQLPEIGTELKAMDECGALESVKAASELYSPVSGKVSETNSAVEDRPNLINTSCYDKGWLFRLELTDTSELDSLMDEENYNKYLKSIDE